jgi:hypothetical protein
MQNAIYSEIQTMINYFPKLRPFNYSDAKGGRILLQGTVPIVLNGHDFDMPLNMSLPDTFPDHPPVVQIPTPPGHQLITSSVLQENGRVLIQKFTQWQPRRTTLAVFVNAIVQYFSQNPPFRRGGSPAPVVRPVVAERIDVRDLTTLGEVEAVSLIEVINSQNQRAAEQMAEAEMAEQLFQIAGALKQSLESTVTQLQAKEAEFAAMDTEVPIDGAFKEAVLNQARRTGFEATKALIREEFEAGRITVDEMLKAVRELGNAYFLDYVAHTLTV